MHLHSMLLLSIFSRSALAFMQAQRRISGLTDPVLAGRTLLKNYAKIEGGPRAAVTLETEADQAMAAHRSGISTETA